MASEVMKKAVELATGVSVEELRQTPIDERRLRIEQARGKATRFGSRFPLIGRGNVLRKRLVDHKQVERDFSRAVNGK